ncbi:MAG: GNAT family N-acetyltransferase [Candidatus Nanopelagicales bacterium]
MITYEWRAEFENGELDALHAQGFGHPILDSDWVKQVQDHSLGWVIARSEERLVGFVNVAWDGDAHAFILDTLVDTAFRKAGVGTRLVDLATSHARLAGCEWLHVDFDDELEQFYFAACGFRPTKAGLIAL